jgi:hypothetical protein
MGERARTARIRRFMEVLSEVQGRSARQAISHQMLASDMTHTANVSI